MKSLLANTWVQALAIVALTSAVLTAQSWKDLHEQVRSWRELPAVAAASAPAPTPAVTNTAPPAPVGITQPAATSPTSAVNNTPALPASVPAPRQQTPGGDLPRAAPSRITGTVSAGGLIEFQTGMGYYEGVGVAKDLARAIEAFERSATAGNGASMARLGWMYWFGEGVEASAAQGAAWFRRGAAAGNAEAQYWLATFHEKGYGNVRKDDRRAVELLRQSAAQGFPKAVAALQARGEALP